MKKALSLYLTGFVLSVLLTVLAYLLVVEHFGSTDFIVAVITVLALGQFLTQLFFFLRLGEGMDKSGKVFTLLFMLLVVFILVGGSIWIMSSLNYRMNLSPSQVDQYLNNQDGF